ncbi:uncharacterized protein LOC115665152 [Syzygium oleosum]|uniref:uncharacterized protein LOC115665152 n=1 Tax=Syzygium oleosum TaxID=219896 RepID=UPI0024B978F1|nr:uncharacterized protein LOC115665152 [Syzygium oleosum]
MRLHAGKAQDPSAIPPPDGELTSVETSLAQSGLQPAPAAPGSSGAEHEPEPEESLAGDDPMDVNLEAILEEEPDEEELEAEPEDEPEDEPAESAEPEEEPEYILPYEQWMDPEFVPEDDFFEEPVKEEQDEVPAKSGYKSAKYTFCKPSSQSIIELDVPSVTKRVVEGNQQGDVDLARHLSEKLLEELPPNPIIMLTKRRLLEEQQNDIANYTS